MYVCMYVHIHIYIYIYIYTHTCGYMQVETLRWLLTQGWSGPLTIEPHLASAGAFGGFSGEQLFEVAVDALRQVVSEAGGE